MLERLSAFTCFFRVGNWNPIRVLKYNILGGKLYRSLILLYTYHLLANVKENIHLVRILAWCLELMHGCAIIIDDIQDNSLNRRGQLCWYKYNDNGSIAITDALMLEYSVHYLIKKYFKGKEYYINLLEGFTDIASKSTDDQTLDLYLSTKVKEKLNLFTMEQYDYLCKNKTSYYTFVLPVISGMYLAGVNDKEKFKQVEYILLEMGRLFQTQNDYLDCFGDIEATGKESNDIQNGSCSWLVVVALQLATPEQRKILEECYGCSDPEKIKRVKQLYIDLRLQTIYKLYEEKIYNLLKKRIKQMSCELPHNLFFNLLNMFYHRIK